MNEEEKIINAYITSGHADSNYESKRRSDEAKERQFTFEAYAYDFITQRNKKELRPACNAGPDFIIDHYDHAINIEAVAPDFRNPITERKENSRFENDCFDQDQDLEHWSTGVFDKTKKYNKYLQNGFVQKIDINIIAISNITFGSNFSCNELQNHWPLLCQYLFDIDFSTKIINPQTGEQCFVSRENFKKTRGGKVETNIFLQPKHGHISAILLFDYIQKKWHMIHNPLATHPIQKEYFYDLDHVFCECNEQWRTLTRKRDNNLI